MAQAVERGYPYHAAIQDIIGLGRREVGWNSYRAPKIAEHAQLRAIELANRLEDLSPRVPPPDVGGSPSGGVVLRWITGEREVEIHFLAVGGDYTVTRRRDGETIEGELAPIDPLKDIVGVHVLGFRP